MRHPDVEPLTDDERHQLMLVLRNTTPADRIRWLDEMRMAFGVEHIKKCRDLRFKMQDLEKPFTPPPADDR